MPVNRLEEYLIRHRRWIVVALLAAAVAARFIGLTRGMWVDELKTWMVARWPLGEMLANRFQEGHLPLYFLFMRVWIYAIGPVDWALRLPSVALGVGEVYLLLRLAEGGYARRVAFAAAALLAIHPVDLWSSQIVRMYSLLAFLSLASTLQMMRLEAGRRWRNFIGFALLGAVGLMSQALYAFVMLGQLTYLLWNAFSPPGALFKPSIGFAARWKCFVGWALSWALAAPVWIILKSRQVHITGEMKDLGEVSVDRMLRSLARAFIGDYESLSFGRWPLVLAFVCMAITTGLVLWALLRKNFLRGIAANGKGAALPGAMTQTNVGEGAPLRAEQALLTPARNLTRYLICSVGVYALAMFVLSNTFLNKAGSIRYYAPLAGPICLGFAAAIFLIPAALPRRAYAIFLTAVLLMVSVAWWRYPGDGLSLGLRSIEARRAPDEKVIGCNDVATENAYSFYVSPEPRKAFVGVSRYLAGYPPRTQRAIEDLLDIEKTEGSVNKERLKLIYKKRPEKLEERLALFQFLYANATLDDSFWAFAYRDAPDFYRQLPELRRKLLDAALPGKRLWLLLYNNEGSPLAEVARSMKEFDLLEQKRFNEAQVILLKRK
ncbi:MAG: glycosyltransferase family 39 protein [Candidatus Sumerlaeota bacterium]|nr:glycosyltransferase family 39 protein [Candidatus Sumerlaeota bacterium]